MKILRNILLIVVALVAAFILSVFFGATYSYLFKSVGGGLFSMSSSASNQIIGLPIAYIFFVGLLFTAFGGSKKYWWIGILLLPAILFELYFDLIHIYFPIAVGLVGWGLGLGVEKGLKMISKK